MKKLLVVLLALTFVVAMATAAFAVTTTSVDGKVEITLNNTDQLGGSVDGKISFDLMKDYGEGYSAGLKIKLTPGDNVDVLDTTVPTPVVVSVDKASSVAYDGAGWIEMKKDLYTLTLKTDINASVGNDLSGFCDLTSGPGLQIVSSSLMEGLTVTGVVNEKNLFYNVNLKAVYAVDPLTVGFGYQTNGVAEGAAKAANDALGVWGSYKVGDTLTVGAEFNSRPNLGNPVNSTVGASSVLVKASYTADPLTVNGSFTTKTYGFSVKDPAKYNADADKYSIAEIYDYANLIEGYLVKVDATYKVSDPFSVNGNVQYLGGKIAGFDINQNQISYKLGATYKVSDKLSTEGWYKAIGDTAPLPNTQLGAKATYTFVDGLVGSLELDSNSANNVSTNAYTAKITATL